MVRTPRNSARCSFVCVYVSTASIWGAAGGLCPWIFRGEDRGLYIASHEAQQGREWLLRDNRAGNHGRELYECTSIKENGKEILGYVFE